MGTGQKKVQHDRRVDRYDRVDRYLTAKARRLADPRERAKQMDEKSKEMSVDGEITAFNRRERARERERTRGGRIGVSDPHEF